MNKLAKENRVHPQTIKKAIEKGYMPSTVYRDGRWYIDPVEFDEWLNPRRTPPDPFELKKNIHELVNSWKRRPA